MNNVRRKQIEKALDLIGEAADVLNEVLEDEQASFDNLPEGIQNSDRGCTMEECIDTIANAIDTLEELESLSEL